MTIVVEGMAGPAIHVLAIGAGYYHHLPDGTGALAQRTFGLRQVSPPRHSARLFADWWLNHYSNPTLPLGSVDILISPAGEYDFGASGRHGIEPATRSNVDAAFARWYSRCDSDSENTAVLYFCGHGIQRENLILLLEDFGANEHSPFDGSFEWDNTAEAMTACVATSQIFVIDACRQVHPSLLSNVTIPARPLKDAQYERPHRQNIHEFHSTTIANRAFGPNVGGPAYFTEAMITALGGPGATPVGLRKWAVTPDSLFRGIRQLLAKSQAAGAPPQDPIHRAAAAADMEIHHLASPPTVPLRVAWNPTEAAVYGQLRLVNQWYPEAVYERLPGPGLWDEEVVAGIYEATPSFTTGQYRSVRPSDSFDVEPPSCRWTVETTP